MKKLYAVLFIVSMPLLAFEEPSLQKEAEEAYVAPRVGTRHGNKVKKASEKRIYFSSDREDKPDYSGRACPEGARRMAGSTGMRSSAGRALEPKHSKKLPSSLVYSEGDYSTARLPDGETVTWKRASSKEETQPQESASLPYPSSIERRLAEMFGGFKKIQDVERAAKETFTEEE